MYQVIICVWCDGLHDLNMLESQVDAFRKSLDPNFYQSNQQIFLISNE